MVFRGSWFGGGAVVDRPAVVLRGMGVSELGMRLATVGDAGTIASHRVRMFLEAKGWPEERGAELLRSGKCNVTEAALAVGYASPSHFSHAFRERFGCCPGLFPLRTPAQWPLPSLPSAEDNQG